MIAVTLVLHGALTRLAPPGAGAGTGAGAVRVSLSAEARVGDALRAAGIGERTEAACAARDGLPVEAGDAVADGDIIHVFPLMGGGSGRRG